MNKYIIMATALLLTACTPEQKALMTGQSETTDLKSCLIREATTRIQDGSAMAAPVRSTVKKMVAICLDVDADAATQQSASAMAQSILTQMMNK